MSGGRATVNRKRGVGNRSQVGDISSVASHGHPLTDLFLIEAKHYKDLALASSLLKGVGELANFWRRACKEARIADKLPMLVACQNHFPTLMLLTGVGVKRLGAETHVLLHTYSMGDEAYVLFFDSLEHLKLRPYEPMHGDLVCLGS